ncbi:MAG: heavy metal translocating P-type ATPase [Halieaceae bacterium]
MADAQATTDPTPCFHCGEPLNGEDRFAVEINGVSKPMCCPGCQAVASLIAGSGMAGFYDQRSAYNERPEQLIAAPAESFAPYDDPQLAQLFLRREAHQQWHASLLIGGMTCAACTWLIEHTVQRLPGVASANVNLQQGRLDVRFDRDQLPCSALFTAVAALGYRVQPFEANARREQLALDYRQDLRRLAVAGIGMMQVGMFGVALHAGDIQGIASEYQGLLRWVSLIVASFVVIFSARPFFQSAWQHLKQGALVMDLPVALAIGLAWVASGWATLSGTGQVYFDSIVMFTFLLLLARFIELRSRRRDNGNWLDAQSQLPVTVTLQKENQWVQVPRLQIQADDRLLVTAGSVFPADGKILVGASAAREDAFSGEHLPRDIAPGDSVFAGTVNIESAVEISSYGTYADTRLAALQRSTESGRQGKPRLAGLADRLASRFVAIVLLVTAATAVFWSQVDPERALWISLSVLVVSCPCALALATPAALANAAAALRNAGILVHGDNALEALARTNHLIFDKTGTLTHGDLTVAKVIAISGQDAAEALALAGSLQQYSNHPIAEAFSDVDGKRQVESADYRIGAGISGVINGVTYRTGSVEFCRELCPALPQPPTISDYWIALVSEVAPIAWISLNDPVRESAAAVIQWGNAQGLTIELLTGDSSGQGPLLAEQLGISEVRAGQTPEDKLAHVSQLQTAGAVVTMVGDGLNDAPVLGRADTSIAMANAADLTRAQADLVMVDADLQIIPIAFRKARQCRRVILQNFAWALSYNACAIPLAASGYIAPWAAAVGMSLSSLLVVGNSLRLNRPVR